MNYPQLNNNLYLHFNGFSKIQNLDNFINLRVLYLENNCLTKIEGLTKLTHLTCLYLQNNYIDEIIGLETNTELVILNLSGNKIKKIENLEKNTKLENLYLDKNLLSSYASIYNIIDMPSLTLLDLQHNNFVDSGEDLVKLFEQCKRLKVLYFKGNEVIRSIANYRRKLIVQLKNLTYLDDRPVREEDRIGATAYFQGGYKAEREARDKYREENDRVNKIRKKEKEMFKENFEERRKKALEALTEEYNKRKVELEDKKKGIIKRI